MCAAHEDAPYMRSMYISTAGPDVARYMGVHRDGDRRSGYGAVPDPSPSPFPFPLLHSSPSSSVARVMSDDGHGTDMDGRGGHVVVVKAE